MNYIVVLLILLAAPVTAGSPAIKPIGALQLMTWLDSPDPPLVLDVRPPAMIAKTGSVPGTVNIPLGELRSRLGELPRDREIWVHCVVGQSAYYACRVLAQHGFNVRNLAGGITSYKMEP